MLNLNAQERTRSHLEVLLRNTGWTVVDVLQTSGNEFLQLVRAIPLEL